MYLHIASDAVDCAVQGPLRANETVIYKLRNCTQRTSAFEGFSKWEIDMQASAPGTSQSHKEGMSRRGDIQGYLSCRAQDGKVCSEDAVLKEELGPVQEAFNSGRHSVLNSGDQRHPKVQGF